MDVNKLLIEYVVTFGWAIVAALAMSVSLAILIKVYDKLTPTLDEMEELKKGNVAVAIVMAAVILAFGYVVGQAMMGGGPVHFAPTP